MTGERVFEALTDCADELEGEIVARYVHADGVHPAMQHKYDRDMQTVIDARTAITTLRALLAYVAGVEQLATFGAKVLLEFHNHGSRGDVDGGWLQDTAVDSGVMYRTERKIPCCDLCNCRGYLTDGDWSECVPITNQDLVYALATRPTEARDDG